MSMQESDGVDPGLTNDDKLRITLQRLLEIEALELRSVLDQASLLLVEAFGADKVDVFLYEATTQTLVAAGTSDTPLGRRQKEIGLDRLPLANGGRTVETFQTGRPYLNGHVDQDHGVVLGVREALGVRSMLLLPLDIAGERRGVLSITSQMPERFTQTDLQFCESVARWVSILVHRSELIEQLSLQAAEQARHAAAQELVTVLAHDLANYLTPLKGRLSLIQHRAEQDKRGSELNNVLSAQLIVDRLQQLVSNLLAHDQHSCGQRQSKHNRRDYLCCT